MTGKKYLLWSIGLTIGGSFLGQSTNPVVRVIAIVLGVVGAGFFLGAALKGILLIFKKISSRLK